MRFLTWKLSKYVSEPKRRKKQNLKADIDFVKARMVEVK